MSRPSHPSQSFLPDVTGFTLVEVVLATGLCSFAMLVILSTLPLGISVLRDANRQNTETEIYNHYFSKLSCTSFSQLTNYLSSSSAFPAYYDVNGQPVSASQLSQAVYTVQCTFSANVQDGTELKHAIIQIGYHCDPKSATKKDTTAGKVSSRTFVLVNKGS